MRPLLAAGDERHRPGVHGARPMVGCRGAKPLLHRRRYQRRAGCQGRSSLAAQLQSLLRRGAGAKNPCSGGCNGGRSNPLAKPKCRFPALARGQPAHGLPRTIRTPKPPYFQNTTDFLDEALTSVAWLFLYAAFYHDSAVIWEQFSPLTPLTIGELRFHQKTRAAGNTLALGCSSLPSAPTKPAPISPPLHPPISLLPAPSSSGWSAARFSILPFVVGYPIFSIINDRSDPQTDRLSP